MADLKEFLKKLEGEVAQELAIEITNEAKRRCPVVTGRLRANIKFKVVGNKITIFNTLSYAPYPEFLYDMPERYSWDAKTKRGGMDRSSLPFMRPALAQAPNFLKDILARKLNYD